MQTKFAMKTEYGVRAMFELAAHHGTEAIQSAEIARRERIPGPFLDQVLLILRRAGLVRSVRGPRGGHLLTRAPSEIRLDEVIASLEGAGADSDCEHHEDVAPYGCILHHVTKEADAAARRVYASHTLADLLRDQPPPGGVFHGIFHPLPARSRGSRPS